MKDELAETLLSKVMGWSVAEKARERAFLQDFARYKYDEYQQFAPGRRFIESLALWLRQFKTVEERRTAYAFIRNRLIFISNAEMRRLVELAFPTIIRPRLIEKAAATAGLSPLRPKAVIGSTDYKALVRRCLVLGLSDGARTDIFRRANPQHFNNEQISHNYEISRTKAADMQKKLRTHLAAILGATPTDEQARFECVLLLDDFTASGTSYLRPDAEEEWKGKIWRVVQMLGNGGELSNLIVEHDAHIMVVLYVAAQKAIAHIRNFLQQIPFPRGRIELEIVHPLPLSTPLDDAKDADILAIARASDYFDPAVDDEHGAVGGGSKQLGYADCRLPLVLSHNTPNNSIFLLWGAESHTFRGLFPRVDRHRRID